MVRIADPESGEKKAEIAAGSMTHGVAFEPSGERVFLTGQDGATTYVFDRATHEELAHIAVGQKPNGVLWADHP